MGRFLCPFLAVGLFFGTLGAQAAPSGSPADYAIQTKYSCQASGVFVRNGGKVINPGVVDEFEHTAGVGKNQAITFGDSEYMIWPRVATGSFDKSLNILAADKSRKFRVIQEIDLGDSQKTKTNISLTVKDVKGDVRPVNCRLEVEWVKKGK